MLLQAQWHLAGCSLFFLAFALSIQSSQFCPFSHCILFCFVFMKVECSMTQIGQICRTVKQCFFEEGTTSKGSYHLHGKPEIRLENQMVLPRSVFWKHRLWFNAMPLFFSFQSTKVIRMHFVTGRSPIMSNFITGFMICLRTRSPPGCFL